VLFRISESVNMLTKVGLFALSCIHFYIKFYCHLTRMHIVRGENSIKVLLDESLSDLKDFVYYNWEGNMEQEPLDAHFIVLYLVFENKSVSYTPSKLAGAKRIVMFHLRDVFTLKTSSFVPIFDLKQVWNTSDKSVYIKKLQEYNFSITMDQFTDYTNELYKEFVLKESSNIFSEYQSKRENDIKIHNIDRNTKILDNKLYKPLLETELILEDHLSDVLYSYVQYVLYSGLKGRRVKLSDLFEKLELSDDIPFIGINGSIMETDNKFRAMKGFDVPQGWMINEKKQTKDYTYRNVKGVVLKMRYDYYYISVNIEANGDVYVTLDMEKRNISGGIISRQTVEYIKEIPYDSINTKVNNILEKINVLPIFSKEKFNFFTSTNTKLLDITARYITKQRINKSALVKTFSALPNNKIFEYRETKGKDTIVSLYYKQSNTQLVINIEDNFHTDKSSVISVFKGESVYQCNVILTYLLKLSKSRGWLDTDKSKQKLSPDTELKQLKKEKVKVDSRSCQKPRQPKIDKITRPLKDSYALEFSTKRYICQKPDYKYPGFTSKNIPCCFKKDQRNNKYYIQNTLKSDINILVSPSNYFLEDRQTFLLKKDNVYVVLNADSELEEIPDSPEYADVEFLAIVSLAQIKSLPKKTNCDNIPDMSKPELDRCNHHKISKVYGYSSFSFPCCFESLSKISTKGRVDEHVFSKNIILPDKREGTFFGVIDVFLNQVVSDNEFEKYQRYGVLQDNYSLLRALMYSTRKLTSIDELLTNLVEFVTKDIFSKLSGGRLAITFEYSDFIEKLKRFDIQTTYILDLLCKFFGVNILLLDNDRQQIVCTPTQIFSDGIPFVVLLRHSPEHYELVIQKHLNKTIVQYTRNQRLIELLLEYKSSTCKRISEYPKDYKYTVMTDYNTVPWSDKLTVKYQVINKYNKVYLLITSLGPLPIKQIEPLENIPKIDIYKLRNSFDYIKLQKAINNVNKFIPDEMSILSQVVSKGKTIGLLLSVGLVVPIKEQSPLKDVKISELNWYYGDEDSYIYNRVEDTSRRLQFWNEYQQLNDLVNKAKARIQQKLYKYIEEYTIVLKDTNTSLASKYRKVYSLVKKLLPDETHFVTSILARDITLDPEYNTLFYKRTRVADDSFTLESIMDIRNYLTKKTTQLPMVL
jgi:hypothetical protein